MSGDALNVALDEVTGPKVYAEALKGAKLPLPGTVIREIPFNYAQTALTLSVDNLTKDGPPPLLKGPEFDADRAAIRAVAQKIRAEADAEQPVDPALISQAQAMIKAVDAKIDGQSRRSTRSSRPRYDAARELAQGALRADVDARDPGDQRPAGGGREAARHDDGRPPGVHARRSTSASARRRRPSSGRSTPQLYPALDGLRDEIVASGIAADGPRPAAGHRAGRLLLGHGLRDLDAKPNAPPPPPPPAPSPDRSRRGCRTPGAGLHPVSGRCHCAVQCKGKEERSSRLGPTSTEVHDDADRRRAIGSTLRPRPLFLAAFAASMALGRRRAEAQSATAASASATASTTSPPEVGFLNQAALGNASRATMGPGRTTSTPNPERLHQPPPRRRLPRQVRRRHPPRDRGEHRPVLRRPAAVVLPIRSTSRPAPAPVQAALRPPMPGRSCRSRASSTAIRSSSGPAARPTTATSAPARDGRPGVPGRPERLQPPRAGPAQHM